MTDVIGTRIDRGVKRGRKTPINSRAARGLTPKPRPDDLGSWKIPADLNPHEVLHCYLTEQTTSQIASQYGLSRRALVKWLREMVPTEWREIQLLRAHANLENGEDGIEVANDALSLARAREQAKAAQWRLQSLDKDYHPKQEITHNIQPVLTINIAALPQPSQVIDLPSSAVQHIPDTAK